ncbi:MAG: murein hydrolase activator EnvC family protein [Solirubrobacteraceae bacterium]
MTSVKAPLHRARYVLVAALLTVGAAVLLVSTLTPAHAASTGQLQQKINAGKGRVSSLSGQVSAANRKVHSLGANVATLTAQVSKLQSDLDAKRLELLKLRSELSAARIRLVKLQAAEVRSEQVLSQQLIGSYEADRPDIVSVVIESTGFPNLLERLAFAQRIRHQDTQIVSQVKVARRAVAAEATHLGKLSVRQQKLTVQVLYERNQVDRTRLALVSREIAATQSRDAKAGQLSSARGQLVSLHSQLNKLEAAQAAAAARAAQPTGSGSGAGPTQSGPITPSSSGGFTFPLPKATAVPPGSWSLDDGVDIAAPGGTPLLAVCAGTVVLHGIGGFGPSAPVIHCDGSLAGYSYVYYGHAGPGNSVGVGTHVSQGQVISQVGYGIVGISTGPHLEIGFADSSGSPIGPGSAGAMASLLHSAYGG